jgi:hypothetical protein
MDSNAKRSLLGGGMRKAWRGKQQEQQDGGL